MALTAFAQNAIIDAFLRGAPLVTPSTWYVALVTTEGATNALAGVEVQGGAYARVPVPATLASWAGTQGDNTSGVSIGTSAKTSNNIRISFPQPTANWGSIVGYELWDQAINGNRWLFDVLLVPKTVSAGDPAISFPPGTLALNFV